jgi:hypothetical protein
MIKKLNWLIATPFIVWFISAIFVIGWTGISIIFAGVFVVVSLIVVGLMLADKE